MPKCFFLFHEEAHNTEAERDRSIAVLKSLLEIKSIAIVVDNTEKEVLQ